METIYFDYDDGWVDLKDKIFNFQCLSSPISNKSPSTNGSNNLPSGKNENMIHIEDENKENLLEESCFVEEVGFIVNFEKICEFYEKFPKEREKDGDLFYIFKDCDDEKIFKRYSEILNNLKRDEGIPKI